jgi:serine/threonine-protein phosphatase 2A regulatory subunit B''
VEQKIWHVVK